jgi:hypothetical protein
VRYGFPSITSTLVGSTTALHVGQRTSFTATGPVTVRVCLISIGFFSLLKIKIKIATPRRTSPIKKLVISMFVDIMNMSAKKMSMAEAAYPRYFSGPLTNFRQPASNNAYCCSNVSASIAS